MPTSFAYAIVNPSCSLFYQIDLKHINKQTTKIMGQKRVKREPYTKNFQLLKQFMTMKKHHLICHPKKKIS